MAEKKTKRKPISKALRFEVFKRDRFTCQYCGRKAPNVTLEVDHIVPVAEGGENELLNLVTSCFDCNRGKGKKKLSDMSTIEKQRNELEQMAERQEQARMMLKWKKEMKELDDMLIEELCDYLTSMTGYECEGINRAKITSCYRRFGYDEVVEAIDIAVAKYFDEYKKSFDKAVNKVGGICYIKRKQRLQNAEQDH